jgi:hypothetical protein
MEIQSPTITHWSITFNLLLHKKKRNYNLLVDQSFTSIHSRTELREANSFLKTDNQSDLVEISPTYMEPKLLLLHTKNAGTGS